jgi:cardiolipin synthase
MDQDDDLTLARHEASHAPLSDCPVMPGNAVRLLGSAQAAILAIFDAIEAARHHLHLEYYIFDDVGLGGRKLSSVLHDALSRGVQVAIVYDSIGSHATPRGFFDGLQ